MEGRSNSLGNYMNSLDSEDRQKIEDIKKANKNSASQERKAYESRYKAKGEEVDSEGTGEELSQTLGLYGTMTKSVLRQINTTIMQINDQLNDLSEQFINATNERANIQKYQTNLLKAKEELVQLAENLRQVSRTAADKYTAFRDDRIRKEITKEDKAKKTENASEEINQVEIAKAKLSKFFTQMSAHPLQSTASIIGKITYKPLAKVAEQGFKDQLGVMKKATKLIKQANKLMNIPSRKRKDLRKGALSRTVSELHVQYVSAKENKSVAPQPLDSNPKTYGRSASSIIHNSAYRKSINSKESNSSSGEEEVATKSIRPEG
jgi:hypothetical protein